MTAEKRFPTEPVDIPSHGWFYPVGSPLATGRVELHYMTARHEDILVSSNLIAKGVVLDKLLEALIVDKSISYGDLLVADKDALLIAARVLGYGKEYPISLDCPACGERNTITTDLTALDQKEVTEPAVKGTNEFEFVLPVSKKRLTFKLLTHRDDQAITAELVGIRKVENSDIDRTLSTRLKHLIVALDGIRETAAIRDFVDNQFQARDSRAFREEYNRINPTLDMSFPFTCRKCGDGRRLPLPIGASLFWPQS